MKNISQFILERGAAPIKPNIDKIISKQDLKQSKLLTAYSLKSQAEEDGVTVPKTLLFIQDSGAMDDEKKSFKDFENSIDKSKYTMYALRVDGCVPIKSTSELNLWGAHFGKETFEEVIEIIRKNNNARVMFIMDSNCFDNYMFNAIVDICGLLKTNERKKVTILMPMVDEWAKISEKFDTLSKEVAVSPFK